MSPKRRGKIRGKNWTRLVLFLEFLGCFLKFLTKIGVDLGAATDHLRPCCRDPNGFIRWDSTATCPGYVVCTYQVVVGGFH